MLDKLKQYIESKNLATPQDHLLVAASGGLDSMVLLQMLHTLGYDVTAAHCNFQLRGDDSTRDEEFVKQYCEQAGISFFSKRFETNNYATERKLSIQMAARELRYAWFDELIKQFGFSKLVTAHHFNDSIETMLLNWIKGGGIESLKGIAPQRGYIIRPLLFAARDQITQYAADNQVAWREDISNQTDDYQRNFIRHQVLPQLRRINTSLENTLLESSRKIEGELVFFDSQLAAWKAAHVHDENGVVKIRKKSLGNDSFYPSLLWRCLRGFGFAYAMCEAIIQASDGQPGKQFFSPTHRLVVDRDHLIVTSIPEDFNEVLIEADKTDAFSGPLHLSIESDVSIKPNAAPHIAVLDADLITFPIRWRKWQPGDIFCPLGMNHHKKISDFLIDKKLSVAEKDTVTVLESAGEIIWVVGHRIDNRYKLASETKRAISFTLHPYLGQ